MNAVAISNNDMVYLHWNVDGKIPDCLGFSAIRHDLKTNSKEALPAMVGFPSDKPALCWRGDALIALVGKLDAATWKPVPASLARSCPRSFRVASVRSLRSG